jgi:hypothetical protein
VWASGMYAAHFYAPHMWARNVGVVPPVSGPPITGLRWLGRRRRDDRPSIENRKRDVEALVAILAAEED